MTTMQWSRLDSGPCVGTYRAFADGQKWEILPSPRGWVLFEGNHNRGTFRTLAEAQAKADALPKSIRT